MAEERVQRRLSAILAADVVGYSRMMEADEAGTLARLKELRANVLHPKVSEYGGRIVKTSGDGTLIEFPSVVDAVQHAIDVQGELARREADRPEAQKIVLRFGINVGDIIIDGDDIYGDGVNVAVRLELIADPGGICITGLVYSQIVGKVSAEFSDGKEYQLKNITRPVQVWRWLQASRNGTSETERTAGSATPPDRQRIKSVINVRPLDISGAFRGREREVEALSTYLADPSVHMVCILGRGGMGKTALATRVLADLEYGRLDDPAVNGIVYLAATSMQITLERLFADVARMFDKPTADALALRWSNPVMSLRAKAEYLIEIMAKGRYFILLDNLEAELQPDGTIEDEGLRVFVEQCMVGLSGVHLVVTSRQKVKLPPAALRTVRTISLEDGLSEDEAIALLMDLDPQNTLGIQRAPKELLRRACRLARGIPRALELLSGLLYEDPTTDLATLISDETLFGEEVLGPLVSVGYKHLKERERRIMEALAVFNNQVDKSAIVHLTQPWMAASDVHAGLQRLINGYFVKFNTDTRMFSLHQLDRDYAYGQIPDAS